MQKIKVIIFDMDGVIVDSESIHEKAGMEVCREFRMMVSKDEWNGFRGKKLEEIFTHIKKKHGKGTESVEKMIERKIELYLLYARNELQLVPGVMEFLKKLKASREYRYALTTSGRRIQQEEILAKFGLSDFFEIMITSEDVKNGKPNPEPYLVTIDKLGELPGECLVVEDSVNGIISAKKAGCQTCGITTTFSIGSLKTAGADVFIDNFNDLDEILFGAVQIKKIKTKK